MTDRSVDLAIRCGALPDKRLAARRVLSVRRFLCASPRYLQQHGVPQAPADLSGHRGILHRENDAAPDVWQFNDGTAIKVHGTLSRNDGDIVLGWALDGHGILMRPERDIADYVDSGRLRIVLPQSTLPAEDLFAYSLNRKNQAARTRAFIDFLVEQSGEMQ